MTEHAVVINPECRAGKHKNCDQTSWDWDLDVPTVCYCECHREAGGDHG